MKKRTQDARKRQQQLDELQAEDLLNQASREQGILRRGGLHAQAKKLILQSVNQKLDRAGDLLDGEQQNDNSSLYLERQALIR